MADEWDFVNALLKYVKTTLAERFLRMCALV